MAVKPNRPGTGRNAKQQRKKTKEKAKKQRKDAKRTAQSKTPDDVVDTKKQAVVKSEPEAGSVAVPVPEGNRTTKKELSKKFWSKDIDEDECIYTPDCIDDGDIPLITEQIHDLRSEYISIQSNFLTVTSIAFVGFGVVLYYAFFLDNNHADQSDFINFVFIALPFLFGISFLNILKYTVRMLGIGSYVSHLEKILDAKAKKNIFLWHRKMVGINGYTIVGLAQIPCYLALFAVVAMKFLENMELLKKSESVLLGITASNLHFLIKLLMYFMLLIGFFSIFVGSTQHKAVNYWSKYFFSLPYNQEIKTHKPFWWHSWKRKLEIGKAQKK